MGQPNSKLIYLDKNGNPMTKAPINESQNKGSEDGKGEDDGSSPDKEETPEDAKEETPAEETDIVAVKKKNMKMWKPYINSVIDLNKDELERISLNFQTLKNKFKDKEVALLVGPDDEAFFNKKIIYLSSF